MDRCMNLTFGDLEIFFRHEHAATRISAQSCFNASRIKVDAYLRDYVISHKLFVMDNRTHPLHSN